MLIAYLWTWLLWLPPLLIAQRNGWLLPSPDNYGRLIQEGFASGQHAVLSFIFSLGVYGPLLGALWGNRQKEGWQGLKTLGSRLLDFNVAARWVWSAVLVAAAMSVVPTGIAWLLGQSDAPVLPFTARLIWFVPLLILQLLTSGLGEEPGWRGYLWPRLQRWVTSDWSIWILGFLWAVWHFPLTIIYTLLSVPADLPVIGVVIAILLSLLGQSLFFIGLSYIYVWLFNNTGSIALVILFHALTNVVPFLLPAVGGGLTLLVGLFPWVIVLTLRWLVGNEEFPGTQVNPPI